MAYIWTVIKLIIQYGPAIWKIVQEIIAMINGVSEFMIATDALTFKTAKGYQLAYAVKCYKDFGDKTRLNELHGELTCQLSNLRK